MSDGTCQQGGCEQPGQLVIDPYAQDVLDETVPVILCDEHVQLAIDEI
jgi:hypothetical protein